MEGTTVELMKMREPGVPTIEEYLEEHLPENGVIGFDGRVVSMGEGLGYETIARKKNGGIVYEYDLVDQFWEDRRNFLKSLHLFLRRNMQENP